MSKKGFQRFAMTFKKEFPATVALGGLLGGMSGVIKESNIVTPICFGMIVGATWPISIPCLAVFKVVHNTSEIP